MVLFWHEDQYSTILETSRCTVHDGALPFARGADSHTNGNITTRRAVEAIEPPMGCISAWLRPPATT
eukprot:COSAG01_NODE_4643_length_4856_cov_13.233971_5_plen_67_part_00